jgi:hypothetical protein
MKVVVSSTSSACSARLPFLVVNRRLYIKGTWVWAGGKAGVLQWRLSFLVMLQHIAHDIPERSGHDIRLRNLLLNCSSCATTVREMWQ